MIAMPGMKKIFYVIAVFLLLAISPIYPVLPVSAADLEARVGEFTLDNGIKVLLIPRPESPTVSLHIAIKVGAVMENEGETGAAHFLEHLMFKGTRTLGTKDYEAEEGL